MEISLLLLTCFVAGLPTSILTFLLVREQGRTKLLLRQQAELFLSTQAASSREHLRTSDILDKAFAQLRAADPWQYQAIQAMNAPSLYDEVYDPSEEAEANRIAERSNSKDELKESLDAEESAILDDIFPGYGG